MSANSDAVVLFSSRSTSERGVGCLSKSSQNRNILDFYEWTTTAQKSARGFVKAGGLSFRDENQVAMNASQERVPEID